MASALVTTPLSFPGLMRNVCMDDINKHLGSLTVRFGIIWVLLEGLFVFILSSLIYLDPVVPVSRYTK